MHDIFQDRTIPKKICILPIYSDKDIRIIDSDQNGIDPRPPVHMPNIDYEAKPLAFDPVFTNPESSEEDEAKPPVPPKTWIPTMESQREQGGAKLVAANPEDPEWPVNPDLRDSDYSNGRYCIVAKRHRKSVSQGQVKALTLKQDQDLLLDEWKRKRNTLKSNVSIEMNQILINDRFSKEIEHIGGKRTEDEKRGHPTDDATGASFPFDGRIEPNADEFAPMVPPRENRSKRKTSISPYMVIN